MTQARGSQISLIDTCYYHLTSRCIRRAFLCGKDEFTNRNCEHRRQWMVDRIRFLTSVFAIDVAAYAVMSNHYHLIVYVNEQEALTWSDEEVCRRWLQLYRNHPLVKRWQCGETTTAAENEAALAIIDKWRGRLSDISWLMRGLNEYIARKANKEDKCQGRFWEGRFKSQALLDEKAVLACMAYVELNPVRAKMASTVQTSEYTSIYERLHSKASKQDKPADLPFKVKPLLRFIGNGYQKQTKGLAFSLLDYFELVEATGQVIREDKRGYIDDNEFPLLKQLGFSGSDWLDLAQHFGKKYHRAVGSLAELSRFAAHMEKKWIGGQRQQANIFN
ncbi:transposase [Thalassomonas actiniarum]|uniref:Transposase n=1 Tax=Thalassomonas actiniarum TaxID=485447 RepID=A0AAF0C3I7_9GAMM|nr:transposase [Thalassomonas actiniarum]WDE01242.1 transposase [Thalassomonas actiniarum]